MSVCVPVSDKVCDVTVSDIISKGVIWYVFREDVYLSIRELVGRKVDYTLSGILEVHFT